ncbi:MAG: hypothetical protein EPO36_04800 [Chloroflexota bacterium]|nr:MAG: hypothetical protein EPO36_04800 [Chloroflexota bacterium]
MTDAWDAPPPPGVCPWCSGRNAPGARQCATCGAAIAQRDDLGGVVVPGVTGVDPNLLGTQSSLASPVLRSQGTLNAINAVSQVNATLGLAAAAAILGQDTVKGMLGLKDADLDTVGKPSEAALQAVEKLDRDGAAAPTASADEIAEVDPPPTGQPPSGAGPTPPAIDPWADLPERRAPDPA